MVIDVMSVCTQNSQKFRAWRRSRKWKYCWFLYPYNIVNLCDFSFSLTLIEVRKKMSICSWNLM